MANVTAIRSVSSSLIKFLESSYPQELQDEHPTSFQLLSSGELANEGLSLDRVVSLFLYRVTVNDCLRNVRSHRAPELSSPLPLNLHYLLSVWAASPETEQVLLAWSMRHLHEHPILDASSLTPDGGWAPDEVIHIAPEELTNEDLLRLWETVAPTYRISYSYVARVVQLDPTTRTHAPPVIATRSVWIDRSKVGNG